LSSTTSSGSGLEVLSSGLTLLQGCADLEVLKWNETSDTWGCAVDNGGTNPWATDSNVVNLVTDTDTVTIGSSTAGGKFFVDGDADEIQLQIQGNGTQTANLVVFEQSNGTDLFTLTNTGNATLTGDLGVNGGDITSSGALSVQSTTTLTLQSAAGTTSSAVTIQSGNASSGASGNITIDNGTFTTGTPTINIGTVNSRAINIGNTTPSTVVSIQGDGTSAAVAIQSGASGTISIGTANVATKTISIGSVGTTAQTTTVNIANTTGSAAQTVNLGSTSSTSTTTIQGGSGGIVLSAPNIAVGSNFITGNAIRQFSPSTGIWTFEDTSGNDLMRLTDAGSTGSLEINTITGTPDISLVSNGGIYLMLDDDASSGTNPFEIYQNGNFSTPVFSMAENGSITTADDTEIFIQGPLRLGVDGRTIADNGAGTPAALTLSPTASYVEVTCNDANGCSVTMSEGAGVVEGQTVTIIALTASPNLVNFTDSAGVTELGSNISLDQYDSLSLIYTGDRWVRTASADN
jgi:hypothetical protein